MIEKYCLDRGISFFRIEVFFEDLVDFRECYLFVKVDDFRSLIVLYFFFVNRIFRIYLVLGEGKFWVWVWFIDF